MEYPQAAQEAIDAFRRLPGIGKKSAQRLVQHMLRMPPLAVEQFAASIRGLHEHIVQCTQCFHMTDRAHPLCTVCRSPSRDDHVICVVEESMDVFAIEQTGTFHGLYHVLQGTLSPLAGIGPDQLTIAPLLERLSRLSGEVEVIFATNPTLEGEATAMYIKDHLPTTSTIRLSRIAKGIPMGGDVDYADEVTLGNALALRRDF